MSTVHTRVVTIADLAAVASLFDSYRQFYERESDPGLATNFIRDRILAKESVILLALGEAGRVLGFCQMYPTFCSVEARPIYALYDLFVAPEARRSGAARALLQAAEAKAAMDGMARMDLTTAKTNTPAQAVYESLGWVRDEAFYAYNKRVEG